MARYLTTGEAAEQLGVHPNTLRNWARQGLVQPVWRTPVRGDMRWDLAELERQLAGAPPVHQARDILAPYRDVKTASEFAAEAWRERYAAEWGSHVPQQPAVIAAVVTGRRGVLLVQRRDGTPPWSFPAGESEPGESPADTVVREVKEETGLLIKPGAVIHERLHPSTKRHMVYVAATLASHDWQPHVGDADELLAVRWVPRWEAEQLMPGMAVAVSQHLATRLTSAQARGRKTTAA